MLIENIGSVTLVNGIVRIETQEVLAGGEVAKSGEIHIPANIIGTILEAMLAATKDIETKFKEQLEDLEKKEEKSGKSKKN